jgi:DNA-binding NarL/FixJ family response regulator
MQRPSVPGPSSQAPERAIREDRNAMRDDGSHGQSKAARGPRVVMIVDDHAHFRSALRHWISGLHAGYELVEAGSGEEAVALAGRREVHVVLMDLELPGMSGIEATRRIRETLPQTPVIIVSQHAAHVYVERARAAGASAYVLKSRVPDDLAPLLAGIHVGGNGGHPHGTADDRRATPMPAFDEPVKACAAKRGACS